MGEAEKINWDEKKRNATLTERGLDFVDAINVIFARDVVTYVDNRKNYGEERLLAFGTFNKRHFCVCYTFRNGAIRIISFRKVHEQEWRKKHG
jgi:uncharacterized DUF497 family protein